MTTKVIRHFLAILFFFSIFACERPMPSMYQVYYSENRRDSAIYVTYTVDADSFISFYFDYNLFFKLYNKSGYDTVYQYHLHHPQLQSHFNNYRIRNWYVNAAHDTIEYNSSSLPPLIDSKSNNLKPSIPNRGYTRPYYHIK